MKITSEVKAIIGIVIVCVLLLGVFVWLAPKSNNNQARDLTLLVKDNSDMTGKMGARVTLVEFGDYQCPACAIDALLIKEIIDAHETNPDFNFVFRNFPLSQHHNAVISAQAAHAAGLQGKYFQMSEQLYKNQDQWAGLADPTALFEGYVKTLGLDVAKFETDLQAKSTADFIQVDLQDAVTLNLDHTPTFFLNGVEVTDLNSLKSKIDSLLAQ